MEIDIRMLDHSEVIDVINNLFHYINTGKFTSTIVEYRIGKTDARLITNEMQENFHRALEIDVTGSINELYTEVSEKEICSEIMKLLIDLDSSKLPTGVEKDDLFEVEHPKDKTLVNATFHTNTILNFLYSALNNYGNTLK